MGATSSVMSAETFKILNLQEKDLDRSNIPQVVGAEGTSLGAIGRIECELKIGKETCKQKFLVCQNLRRHLILGVDFAKTYAAGVHWTKHNSFVLTIDGVKVAETTEKHQLPSVLEAPLLLPLSLPLALQTPERLLTDSHRRRFHPSRSLAETC